MRTALRSSPWACSGSTASAWRGWEIGAGKRGLIPASVRQAPGGYRSFTYWRGGK